MLDFKLIKEGLSLVDNNTGSELINIAKGKNKYPSNFKEFIRMLNFRYG